jgi:ABC-type Fe3+/spermidine/putrescine transport system ATPase subunit
MVMADRIVILNRGRIEQQGRPEQIYNRPESPFVARFMGAENVVELAARLAPDRIEILRGPHNEPAFFHRPETDAFAQALPSQDLLVTAYFRGEAAELGEVDSYDASMAPRANEVVLSGRVTQVSYPGGTWRHTVAVGEREVQVDAASRHAPPASVRIRLPVQSVFIFPHARDAAPGEPDLQALQTEGDGQPARRTAIAR